MAIVVWLVLLEGLYLRALRVLRGRGVARAARWQVAAWHGAMALWIVGLLSPIDSLGDDGLSMHMLQHLLIADLAAPLMLVGLRNPVLGLLPAARACSCRWRARAGCAAASASCAGRWWRCRSTCWCSTAGTSRSSSRPPCATRWSTRSSTRRSSRIGVLVWWSVLEPKRRRLRGELWKIGHILAARFLGMFLGMSFVLIRVPIYTGVYGDGERALGLSPIADQQLAGGMMVVARHPADGVRAGVLLLPRGPAVRRRRGSAPPRGARPVT